MQHSLSVWHMFKLVLFVFFVVATTVQERADYDYDEHQVRDKLLKDIYKQTKKVEKMEIMSWKVQVAELRAKLWHAKDQRDRRTSNMGTHSRSEYPKKWSYLDNLYEYITKLKNDLWWAKENVWYRRPEGRETSNMGKPYFKDLNPMQEINKNYDKWKSDVNSKYYHMIHAELQTSGSDACAKLIIEQYWQRMGDDAYKAGTKMHERAERICNGMQPQTGSAAREDAAEMALGSWSYET